MYLNLITIPSVRRAIKSARAVYVQPRFGCSEHWVKVTKAEALNMLESFPDHFTPEDAEMYAGTFGTLKDKVLYMG
jgi:hypothetical protein